MPGGVLSSKSSLPHLFLPQMQGRLMMTLFTSKFVFFWGGAPILIEGRLENQENAFLHYRVIYCLFYSLIRPITSPHD